ncbi:MAG TPA: phosphoribosylamine--glycine ligase [Actinomycetota bacterium]|jgi:phosphoribosylamine--glycine ligase|nr:phosphoribosylamine--glycine ligase [Actinomycetota bacterium]
MRVLVVGQGGREHALVWKLSQNPSVERLLAAPGNAGIQEFATCLPVAANDTPGILELVDREGVDLTVVGPEAPLVTGLVDELESRGHRAFGPSRDGARIEASKVWSRRLCDKHGISGPRARSFGDLAEATAYLEELDPPYVVKADGLAAGKGVTVAETRDEALRALKEALVDRVFGEAGRTVLVEEYLEGREVSALALTDGRAVIPLPLAQDYKRALDGDRGQNTGGMGAYSPVPWIDAETQSHIVEDVLRAAVRALEDEGVRYRGVLYAGLMLTAEGPKVLEFNCRFGDPEAQAVLPRLQSDLGESMLACVEGNLGVYRLRWTPRACVTVVLASGGYPGPHPTGLEIRGLEEAAEMEDVLLFHAGTARRDGRVVTAGGRVLSVTALGRDLAEARSRAYEACSRISFEGMNYRSDIALEAAGG